MTPTNNNPRQGQQTPAQQQAEAQARTQQQQEQERQLPGQQQADMAVKKADQNAAAADWQAQEAARKAEEAQAQQKEAERVAQLRADEAAQAKSAAEKPTKLTLLNVLVRRDEQTEIPTTVYKHELPILQQMHSPDFVRVVGEEEVEVAGFNPATEMERLRRKYRNRQGIDPVAISYRNDPRELAKEAGVSYSGSAADKPARSSQRPAKKKVIGKKR